MSRNITIDSNVFEIAPNYVRVVLAANGPGSGSFSPELERRFASAVGKIATTFGGADVDIAQLPAIAPWRTAFRDAGWSASKFRSSIEALLRRAARGELRPIGLSLVDAGTVATLEQLVPIGVHVLDDVPEGDLVLGSAVGDEGFETLEGDTEQPEPGEIIYKCSQTVLTRRWVWRQGRIGSISGDDRVLAVNVDVIDPTAESVEDAVRATGELLELCGTPIVGRLDLDRTNPTGQISGWKLR